MTKSGLKINCDQWHILDVMTWLEKFGTVKLRISSENIGIIKAKYSNLILGYLVRQNTTIKSPIDKNT